MTTTVIISLITVLLMIGAVLFKPYINLGKRKIGLYWIIPLLGAILILALGKVPFNSFIEGITKNTAVNPLKILALFLSMSIISIFLGDAGFFSYIADKIFIKAKKGGIKLFLLLYLVVAVLTVFTSNDIIILTFTPPICVFCKKAKVSPIPYLFGEFVAANTWSMALIVGNPTNIYLAGTFGVQFFEYFKVMWLPTLLAGVLSLGVLLLLFRKKLSGASESPEYIGYGTHDESCPVKINKFLIITALVHLFICILFLAIADFIGIEMWIVCVVSAVSLTLFFTVYGIIKEKSGMRILRVFKAAPYELIPFVISMFVIVLALYECGFTNKVSSLILTGKNTDGITFGFISALSSNLLNNIPMSVLFERIIEGKSLSALYGAVIGSNIGAFITPVGALAGIMWNKILTSHGVKFPFFKFVLYGITVALPSILVATLPLLIL